MLPIEYRAIVRHDGGRETFIDLSEPGWLNRPEMHAPEYFTISPVRGDIHLPAIAINLAPLPDGTPRRLVYFSRVLGGLRCQAGEPITDITIGDDTAKVRLYCIGWQAIVGGRNVKALNWIFPGGSVVMTDEPDPGWIDQLIQHYMGM